MPWLNRTEAGKYLHVGRDTLERFINAGLLPACQLPGQRGVHIHTDDLDALMRRYAIVPRAPKVAMREIERRGEVIPFNDIAL